MTDGQYGAFGDPMILPSAPAEKEGHGPRLDPFRLEVHRNHRLGSHEYICEMRKTSMFLYDAFTELVRKIYRDNLDSIIGTPTRKWGRTPQHDGIWIDTELNWKPANPDFLPAVYVKLDQVQYSSVSGNQGMPVDMDLENGVYEYDRIGQGAVTFMHVARTSGEAVALCDNTRYYLSDFCSQIADDLCFSEFYEAGVKPLSQAEKDSTETYSSSTTFAFKFHESWSIKHESPILRSVDMLQSGGDYGILELRGTEIDLHRPQDDERGHETSKEEKVDA